jgi:hypothetical protein
MTQVSRFCVFSMFSTNMNCFQDDQLVESCTVSAALELGVDC